MKQKLVLASALALAATATPAFAYLDPGTGSMLLQGLIGGIAAVGAVLSVYKQKIKDAFSRKKSDPAQ